MYKGIGCVGSNVPGVKCLGCSGFGTVVGPGGTMGPAPLLPPEHADAASDMALIHAEVQSTIWKASAATAVVVLLGMYFIEEYWGRH